jgi:hypothetical protein
MKKKVLSVLLSTAMVASLLVGCGSSSEAPAADDAAEATEEAAEEPAEEEPAAEETEEAAEETEEAAEETEEAVATPEDTGSVLNIYCWNDEFARRMADHLPGYEVADKEDATKGGTYNGITVKFNVTPSDDNAYQNNLDATLPGNADASEDDKVDIFLIEADYALKYVDTDLTMPVSELGISESELANQYQYTKDVMTASDGSLKGLSWQGCPGVLIYNREAAKDVFGSDDPDTVQAKVKDWATFTATAKEVADKGYKMTATVNDTYRVYSNNVSKPWVEDGTIQIDDNIMQWVDDSKAMVDAGETTTAELWSDDWNKGFYPDGKVFCYFGPAWLINFCMAADTEGSIANAGGWGACEGPQGFYWGGTWIAAATGTDNPATVAEIMRALTTDESIMTDIVKADSDFVNNKPAMEAAATNDEYAFDVLGGQNPLAMFAAGADKISLSNITEYDQGCTEEFQAAMKDYFDGNASKDEALDAFYTAITEKYPELTVE